MSPDPDLLRLLEKSFPRVSGDEPMEGIKAAWNGQFSPRERG